ncbi:hypothetical protein H6F84_18850 [Microcoleus sp. FACHB-84]|nr:hypothetical protein [Microcoleus sp. FACHB-84]
MALVLLLPPFSSLVSLNYSKYQVQQRDASLEKYSADINASHTPLLPAMQGFLDPWMWTGRPLSTSDG